MTGTSAARTIPVQPLTEDAFAPFGWMLGRPFPKDPDPSAYTHPATDFWSQHLFRTGAQDGTEILWVNYRSSEPGVTHLEKHLFTEQAIVPLTGSVIQLMATSHADGSPDMAGAAAFLIAPGQGICMRPGAWHATRALRSPEVRCLMLTRASTTRDLVAHLAAGQPARESAIVEIPRCELVATS